MRNLVVAIVAQMLAMGLAGCVTETTGGGPEPAATAERVQAQLDLASPSRDSVSFNIVIESRRTSWLTSVES